MTSNFHSSNQSEEFDHNKEKWDIFEEPPELFDDDFIEKKDIWVKIEKVTKVFLCVITFIVVLGGSVISKGSLLFITAQLNRKPKPYCNENVIDEELVVELPQEEIVAWYWVLIFIYFIPQLSTFLRSLRILLFKKWKIPSLLEFISVFLGETSSTIGNSILVFYVLPKLDFIRGCLIMNCLCLVPSILSLWSNITTKSNEKSGKIFKVICLDILCILIQGTGIILLTVLQNGPDVRYLPLSAILISFGWWENYIKNPKNQKPNYLTNVITSSKTFPNSRYFTYCIVSLWKCTLFFGMMNFIEWCQYGNVDHLYSSFLKGFNVYNINIKNVNKVNEDITAFVINNNLTPIWVLLTTIIASYLTYIFGKFACKINIQICYAIPLYLSGLVTLVLLIVCIEYNNCNSYIIPSYFFNTPTSYKIEDLWLIFMGLLLLLSYILITFHIWKPNKETLPSTERLYVRPYYEPFLIDQDLTMNRRREMIENENEKFSLNKEDIIPTLYVCGTMWHETKEEMLTFLKSIMTLDEDHCCRKIARDYFNSPKINCYKLESHIVFDDAFIKDSQRNEKSQINDFVKDLITSVDDVASMIHKMDIKLKKPVKYITPYGGRLEWILPGKTKLIAHLKDNDKIRPKKRWSQVMYLYYILGHNIAENKNLKNKNDLEAQNTYILSVDGDIHFKPQAIHMLLEQMKKDKTLAAACGRVHPVGKGIFSWYQKFEYAISHWMYKASESITGCVLCCPGCFTIFRASAIMSIVKKLTTKSTKAVHFIKFDHGEDRWISTLLVLCGFKVGYVASSDAYTNCPEGFRELYNQRRRWIPSTTANILDLLSRTQIVTKVNENVSFLYMSYQFIFNIMTIITPSMVFWIVVNMCMSLFQISTILSLVLNLIVILMYISICAYVQNEKIQIQIALILCGIYTPLMCAFFISDWFELLTTGFSTPWTLFFCLFLIEILIVTLCHPREIYYLKYLPIYYVMIPTMHMILFIYSLFNIHKVSWGTREVNKSLILKLTEGVSTKTWMENDLLKYSIMGNLSNDENTFWTKLIEKYLHPLDNAKDRSKIMDDLKDLREKVLSTLFIINAMYISVLILLTSKNITIPWPFNDLTNGGHFELELFNTILVLGALLLFFIQLVAIFIHRFGTFTQTMSNTNINLNKSNLKSDPIKLVRKYLKNRDGYHKTNKANGEWEQFNDEGKSNVYTYLEDVFLNKLDNNKICWGW